VSFVRKIKEALLAMRIERAYSKDKILELYLNHIYLGLGAPPPNASWGRMLQEAQGTVLTAPVGAIAPGIAIIALVLGVNFLADGLRDLADPTRRRSR